VGAIPNDTVAVISEFQQTLNHPDAMEFANLDADYAMPTCLLLIDSYGKAQEVATKGRQGKLDAMRS